MGVAQVNKAMTQVDKVTQRNAAWAEELSSTADQMAAHAENLQKLMSVFRADRSAAGATARPTAISSNASTDNVQQHHTRARQDRSHGSRQSAMGVDVNGATGFKHSQWTNEL